MKDKTMKKLTLNQKEYDHLLKNNLNTFLIDKNVVIKNDTTNVLVQKTKRYLENKDILILNILQKLLKF
jgi:predicted metal-binding transcription factor (methanogenesis marker protein 9)